MTEFYAQPYSIDHIGFYFGSVESFEDGMEKLNAKGCDEVEIQFIDGEAYLAQLAKSAYIGQGDITFWFEELDDLDEEDATRLCFLLDTGFELKQALERYDDVYLHHGTAEDYAYDLINETCEVPEYLANYIDYKSIAHDMELNGEIVEIEHDLIITNAHEF